MNRTQLTALHLDSSDFVITRIGFGAWAIDGSGWSFGWGPQDDGDSISVVRRALDLGVGWIDTDAVRSLTDFGQAEAARSDISPDDRPYVFAKCGLIFEEGYAAGEPRHLHWPVSIRQECEASLRRLGVERVDLYQLRWPGVPDTRSEDLLRNTTSRFASHRIGLAWYGPGQVELLADTLSRSSTPVSAVVAAWTLTSPGVASAIVSAGSAEQIEGWIDATTLVLSRASLGEIVTAIGRTGARHHPEAPAVLAA